MYLFYLTCNNDENSKLTRIFDQFSDLHQAYNGKGREGWKEERREGRKSRPREKEDEGRSLNVRNIQVVSGGSPEARARDRVVMV